MLQLSRAIRGLSLVRPLITAMIISVLVYQPLYGVESGPQYSSNGHYEKDLALVQLAQGQLVKTSDLSRPMRAQEASALAEQEQLRKVAKTEGLFSSYQHWHQNLPDKELAELNLPAYEDLKEEQKELLRDYFSEPSRIGWEMMQLQVLLVEKLEYLEKTEGLESVEARIRSGLKSDTIEVVIPGVGKAEISLIGGETNKLVPRLTHFGTHLSYIFLDGTGVSPENPDLRRSISDNLVKGSGTDIEPYDGIAKSQIAGSDFIHKKHNRETVVISPMNHTLADGTRFVPKPKSEYTLYEKLTDSFKDVSFSENYKAQYFGHRWNLKAGGLKSILSYWRNIHVPASRKDWELGVLSGVIQFGVSGMLSFGLAASSGEMSWAPAMLSLAYGSIIGVWNNTYRNFGMGGSREAQVTKFFALSASFAYFLSYFRGDFADVAVFSAAALATTHLDIFTNNAMNSALKPLIYRVPEVREKTGVSLGTVKIGTPNMISLGTVPTIPGQVESKTKNVIVSVAELAYRQEMEFYQQDLRLVKKGITKAELEKIRSERLIAKDIFYSEQKDIRFVSSSILGINYDTGFSKPTTENQSAYTVLYTGKMIDLLNLPQGKLLFALMFPLVEYHAMRYLEKNEYKIAKEYRQEWEDKKFDVKNTDDVLKLWENLERYPKLQMMYLNALIVLSGVVYAKAVVLDLPSYVAQTALRTVPKTAWAVGRGSLNALSKGLEYSVGIRTQKSSERPEDFNKETRLIQSVVDAEKEKTLLEKGSELVVTEVRDYMVEPGVEYLKKHIAARPALNSAVQSTKKYVVQKMSNKSRLGKACRYVWLNKQERRALAERGK